MNKKAMRNDEINVFELFELNIDIVGLKVVACSRLRVSVRSNLVMSDCTT